jgi:hypothetical protein
MPQWVRLSEWLGLSLVILVGVIASGTVIAAKFIISVIQLPAIKFSLGGWCPAYVAAGWDVVAIFVIAD